MYECILWPNSFQCAGEMQRNDKRQEWKSKCCTTQWMENMVYAFWLETTKHKTSIETFFSMNIDNFLIHLHFVLLQCTLNCTLREKRNERNNNKQQNNNWLTHWSIVERNGKNVWRRTICVRWVVCKPFMITKWMNGEHRLNFEIEISTSSHSKEHPQCCAMAFSDLSKKKVLNRTTQKIRHSRTKFIYHDNDRLLFFWSSLYLLNHLPHSNSKWEEEMKKHFCVCSSIEFSYFRKKMRDIDCLCVFYSHTPKIKSPQMLSHKNWK